MCIFIIGMLYLACHFMTPLFWEIYPKVADFFMVKKNFVAGNHKNIFNDARVPWSEYRYYDPKTVGLDFDGMIMDIKVLWWTIPPTDIKDIS